MRTLTSHNDIDRLFAGGRRVTHPALLVLAAPSPPEAYQGGRVVFVAGKRLGSAVVRNRAKRVLRETVRRSHADLRGWDIALVARSGTSKVSPSVLDEALARALAGLGAG
jgi:ribonuclease P protein component